MCVCVCVLAMKNETLSEITEGYGVTRIKVGMHRNENSWPKPNKMKHWAEYRTRFFNKQKKSPPCRPVLTIFFFSLLHKLNSQNLFYCFCPALQKK